MRVTPLAGQPVGINGSSPAPRVAPSSPGKGKSCRPTPTSSSASQKEHDKPCYLAPKRHGEPGEDGHPSGLTLCQEFGHAALVALLAFLGLAGQLLVCRLQPLWSKGN